MDTDDGVKQPAGLGDKVKTRIDLVKKDAIDVLKNDLIGVDDWKRSKISSITGFGIATRAISRVGSAAAESSGRLGILFGSLTDREQVAELGEGGTEDERFLASMELHGKTERDLQVSLRNSFWSTWLYALVAIAYLVFVVVSLVVWPVANWVGIVARMGPFPLIVALWFKHSYTNWMIRERRLGRAMTYLASLNYLPRMR